VQLERRLREISGVSGELPREAWSQRRDPKWSDEVLDGTGDNNSLDTGDGDCHKGAQKKTGEKWQHPELILAGRALQWQRRDM
jgi:hypothetical protein